MNVADTALFSSAYAGSVRYYAAMMACGVPIIDACERVDKHSWIHNHCRIVGANGVQCLAIPVEKPAPGVRHEVRDMRISEHGDWRRIHWGAIYSAYGKSPFFEYIAPDLQALYERGDHWLVDFNEAMHNLVVDFLDLPIHAEVQRDTDHPTLLDDTTCTDLRRRVGDKKPDTLSGITDMEYYQIWAPKHGFTANLSILDLLMNTGREAVFTLCSMAGK